MELYSKIGFEDLEVQIRVKNYCTKAQLNKCQLKISKLKIKTKDKS